MQKPRRIYVSVPRDHHLDERQRRLKHALLNKLEKKGLEPQEFQVSGLPRRSPYSFEAVREIMARCHGVLILAFARWHDESGGGGLTMPTVWNHFEGAFAVAMRKEILVITEEHVAADGITWGGGGEIVVTAPSDAEPDWLDDSYAGHQLDPWIEAVQDVRDVFLAYSSRARATANDVQKYVKSRGYTVMDWELDFAAGGTILEALNDATRKCLGGITLLTKDDDLVDGDLYHAAPRDNVIFELGLFVQNTGHQRVLVIREEGTKMPADLGGSIYLPLKDRNDIAPIHSKIEKFLEDRL